MTSTFLKAADTPWLALDGNLTVFEVIALVGVLVWGGALIWMAASDVVRFRAHHGHHVDSKRQATHGDNPAPERPR